MSNAVNNGDIYMPLHTVELRKWHARVAEAVVVLAKDSSGRVYH